MADVMFRAVETKRGWRIFFSEMDICGAVDEGVARETAICMNEYRKVHP